MDGNKVTMNNLSCFHSKSWCDGCEYKGFNKGGAGLEELFRGRMGVMNLHIVEIAACRACLEALMMFFTTLKQLRRLRMESAHQFQERHMLDLLQRFSQLAVGECKVEVALSLCLDGQHWQDVIRDWGLGADSWLSGTKMRAVPGEYLMPELTEEERAHGFGGWDCTPAEHKEWLCVVDGREAIWRFVEQRYQCAVELAKSGYIAP